MNLILPKIVYGHLNEQENAIKSLIKNRKAFIIVDDNTVKCRENFISSALYKLPYLILNEGEKNKSINQVFKIWDFLNIHNATRKDIVFLLGGGIICDLGAFAASTYKRGLDFVHIPTSLLAMVDASIGGKTGINYYNLKNNIGTFSHPIKIFVDVEFLKTLPKKEIFSGMAEVFKHAIISDQNLWEYLKTKTQNKTDYKFVIKRSIDLKVEVVKKDIFETNLRKCLNLGHTIGHAIESYLLEKNKPTLHGFAIAKGLIIESFIAYKINILPKEVFLEIRTILNKFFEGNINFIINANRICEIVKGDKKNTSEKINFTLPQNIGKVVINKEIDFRKLKSLITEFIEND